MSGCQKKVPAGLMMKPLQVAQRDLIKHNIHLEKGGLGISGKDYPNL